MQAQQYARDCEREPDGNNHVRPRAPLIPGRNLLPEFAAAMQTLSQAGGVLARLADMLPNSPGGEAYHRILTQAANHLLPVPDAAAASASDARHVINNGCDARLNIEQSCARADMTKS